MREASRRPRVIAIETGDQTPSLSMLGGETPRERIVRRTLNAPNTPTYSDLRKCSECETPIRPANTLIRDFPGTKSYGGHGLCGTCYHRAHKAVAA